MNYLFENIRVINPENDLDQEMNVLIEPKKVTLAPKNIPDEVQRISGAGKWCLPGLIDLQVHFRQPGFEYKETLASGAAAALAGGVTSVVVMPNTNPTLDSPEFVAQQNQWMNEAEGIDLYVAAAATYGLQGKQNTNVAALKEAGAHAITDDGLPVMDDEVMRQSLKDCFTNDLLFMQHAEDIDLTQHAPMNLSETSRKLGVRGQAASAEAIIVERDLKLVEETGARYHVLHTSTARSLNAIREAKQKGLPVSCEASPHHLILNDTACEKGDPNKKMNPPLRDEADRLALIEGLVDGSIDAVATDHAPHSNEEKAQSFEKAPFGVIGLETAFAAVLRFVHEKKITPMRAVELMTTGPARVLRSENKMGSLIGPEQSAHVCIVDPELQWQVTPETLHGKSSNSAFLNETFQGKVVATFVEGELRYNQLQA